MLKLILLPCGGLLRAFFRLVWLQVIDFALLSWLQVADSWSLFVGFCVTVWIFLDVAGGFVGGCTFLGTCNTRFWLQCRLGCY